MAIRLGIDTHLHALRNSSAAELLTAGVDLRTVSVRLGNGGGGATTLRVYAGRVSASDQKAAEILGSAMPTRARTDPQVGPKNSTKTSPSPSFLKKPHRAHEVRC